MIKAKCQVGMREVVKRAAAVEGVSAGEFVRRALCARVERVGSTMASAGVAKT